MTENILPQNEADDSERFDLLALLIEASHNESKQAYAAMLTGIYQIIEEAKGEPDIELRAMIGKLAYDAACEDEDEMVRQLDEMAAIRAEQKQARRARLSAQRADYHNPGWSLYQLQHMPQLMGSFGHWTLQ